MWLLETGVGAGGERECEEFRMAAALSGWGRLIFCVCHHLTIEIIQNVGRPQL